MRNLLLAAAHVDGYRHAVKAHNLDDLPEELPGLPVEEVAHRAAAAAAGRRGAGLARKAAARARKDAGQAYKEALASGSEDVWEYEVDEEDEEEDPDELAEMEEGYQSACAWQRWALGFEGLGVCWGGWRGGWRVGGVQTSLLPHLNRHPVPCTGGTDVPHPCHLTLALHPPLPPAVPDADGANADLSQQLMRMRSWMLRIVQAMEL